MSCQKYAAGQGLEGFLGASDSKEYAWGLVIKPRSSGSQS